jgi:hypothetical protein
MSYLANGQWLVIVYQAENKDSGASAGRLDVGLSTRGSWVRIPAKARRGICEQDTLHVDPQLGVAIISHADSTPVFHLSANSVQIEIKKRSSEAT